MELRPGYKQTEIGVFPSDWEIVAFGGIVGTCIDYRGRTPRKLGMDWGGGDVLALSANNVQMGRIAPEKEAYFGSEELYHKWMRQGECAKGDVLLTMEAPLGNVAQIPDSQKYILSQRVILIKPNARIDRDFLFHLLQGTPFQELLEQNSTGSTAKGIQRTKLEKLEISFPKNASEQSAIATALGDADALLEAQDALIAKKRAIKQGAMQELLTGKRRLPGFSGEWEVKRLDEISVIDPENLGANTPNDYSFNYISLEDVDSGVLRSHSEQVLGSAPSRARRKLKSGDVLVSTVRPNLKSHLIFSQDGKDWVCSTGFSVVRCMDDISHPAFVFAQVFAAGISSQIDALLTGSNYPAINSRDVRQLTIPVPSHKEQTAIAEVLSDMDTELTALEAQRAKTTQLKQGMMQALLTGRIRLV